ncbi:hypothetical protein [Streptomyces halstedii]|uniref:hypothetical protein n=1 Tax=Streptomyces halstedii TaxID=1944 RepID=UPI00334CD5C7
MDKQYRSISDIESGRRDDYSASILALIERAYAYKPGAITAFLEHEGDPAYLVEDEWKEGEPDVEAEHAREWIAANPVEAMREVMRAAMRDPAVRQQLGL